jgi:hypothetical protein
MNIPTKFQLNRMTNTHRLKLLIKDRRNVIYKGCLDMLLRCSDTNSNKLILLDRKALSGHPVPITVLNDFKLCSRSRDCGAIINIPL